MICSEEVCTLQAEGSVFSQDIDPNCLTVFNFEIEDLPDKLKHLIESNTFLMPLIPTEVTLHLLRIQSKYLDDHPCLCTSRFRHTLHQLGDDSHQKLDKLCNELQLLTLENCEEVSTASSRRKFYNCFLPTIFDIDSLQLHSIPPLAVLTPEEPAESGLKSGNDVDREVLLTRLESILARFVSDYRAIFAIEIECSISGAKHDDESTSHSIVDHEHRKRHEEEDSCPEEIKQMKVACAELSLECGSSKSETPKKERHRGGKPKSLSILVANSDDDISNNTYKTSVEEPDRDHHVHRYYSLLRGDHSNKGSHHSTRDPNHPPRHGHHHHHHHNHHNHHQSLQQFQHERSNSPSSPFLGSNESKEFSASPQKWSPNVHNSSTIFQFHKILPEMESKVSPTEEIQTVSSTQRKRKDSRGPNPDHSDTKRISRSSSEILTETNTDLKTNGLDSMMHKSKSFCEKQILAEDLVASLEKTIETTSTKMVFYVSDEDISNQDLVDETDCRSFVGSNFSGVEDSNASLIGRFDREMGLVGKYRRPLDRSKRQRKGPRSRSSHKNENEEEKQFVELKRVNPVGGFVVDVVVSPPEPANDDKGVDIPKKSSLERDDSFDSSLSSSPSSNSSNSLTSDIGQLTAEEDYEDEKDDDDVTIREENKSYLAVDDEHSLSKLRRSSWESVEPVVQDHMQQPDDHRPVVSWVPPMGMFRESPSTHSSDSEDFSTRHFGLMYSQKHLDPSHIQRIPTEKDSSKRTKLKQLNKQLKSIKRKLEDLEAEFEKTQGYKPSHADKQRSDTFRRLLSDHSKIRKQIQVCKESDFGIVEDQTSSGQSNCYISSSDDSCDHFFCESPGLQGHGSSKRGMHSLEAMENMFQTLEQKVNLKRQNCGRPYFFNEMTNDQILDEQNDLRGILHQMEENFGFPVTEEEKNITKDVFERYRTAKRLLRKNSVTFRSKENSELETIPEDLEIPLTLASPQHRIFIEVTTTTTDQRTSEVRPSLKSMTLFSSHAEETSLKLIDENLHAMTRYELFEVQRRTREEKKHFRRIVKEKEEKYMRDNSLRRIPKDERSKIDEINYNLYKKSKAKLKLIEALLSKGRQ